MTVTLSTIGSAGVTIECAPAALPEAGERGVQITLGLHDGPLVLTLTADEADELGEQLHVHWPVMEIDW
jgi:hypothetical protein